MMAKTHTAFALAIGATTLLAVDAVVPLSLPVIGISLFCISFGSLFPDIDEPRSTISYKFPMLSELVSSLTGHREITHSIIPIGLTMVLGLALIPVSPLIALAVLSFGFGCGLHVLGDMCTVSGVPILLPFKKKKFHLLPKSFLFKTFSSRELPWLIGSHIVSAAAMYLLVVNEVKKVLAI